MSDLYFALRSPTADESATLRAQVERAGGSTSVVRASGALGVQELQLLVEASGPVIQSVATVLVAWVAARSRHSQTRPEPDGSQAGTDRAVILVLPDGTELRCHADDLGAARDALVRLASVDTSASEPPQ